MTATKSLLSTREPYGDVRAWRLFRFAIYACAFVFTGRRGADVRRRWKGTRTKVQKLWSGSCTKERAPRPSPGRQLLSFHRRDFVFIYRPVPAHTTATVHTGLVPCPRIINPRRSGNFLRGTPFLPQSNDLLNTSFSLLLLLFFSRSVHIYVVCARASYRIVCTRRLRNKNEKRKKKSPTITPQFDRFEKKSSFSTDLVVFTARGIVLYICLSNDCRVTWPEVRRRTTVNNRSTVPSLLVVGNVFIVLSSKTYFFAPPGLGLRYAANRRSYTLPV